MSDIVLKGVVSPELSLVNKLPNGTQLKLDTKYSYNVQYSKSLTCQGELSIEVFAKDQPEKFAIKTKTVGIFSYKDGADKDILHVKSFKALFPYARALITNIVVNAGMPPIVLPEIDVEGQSIYRIDTRGL